MDNRAGLQTTDWKVTEVGSAYLPKKRRGEAREVTIKGQKLRPTTSDKKEREPKLRPTDEAL
jgi:hypothetical protein